MKHETPLDRLLRWIEEAGLNQSQWSRKMRIDPQLITNWIARGNLPEKRYRSVAEYFGRSIDELVGRVPEHGNLHTSRRTKLSGAETYEEDALHVIPVLETAQLDTEGCWTEVEHPVGTGGGYIKMPSKDREAYSVRVIGDAMHPQIKSGQFVVIEPGFPCEPGDTVLLVTTDGLSMVRELIYRRDGVVAVQSLKGTRLTLPEQKVKTMHFVAAVAARSYFRRSDVDSE